MTNSTIQADLEQIVNNFTALTIDDKLALLWFVYKKMGQSITPAAPGAAETEIAEGLYNQVKELSHQEQLEVQRNLFTGKDTLISREYGSLSDNTKLLFWYRLAQGMEAEVIIPMPENYELGNKAKELLGNLESMDFEQQITFLRKLV
ncbi:MAG: orange carotenoid protein N-terminal domain-containing protein [Cyanobacteria bacterium J06635_10]